MGSAFNTYPPLDPARFRCDAMVIADMGSVRPGVPTLTVALRGTAVVTIEVKTLAGPKHSGQYGGAAPDALLVLLRAIASLHDDHGNVVVPGLRREEWTGASYSEDEFRELAELQPGMPFIGTGSLGERLWSGPAITVTGMDVLPVEKAVNAVVPYARAKINLRVHPAQDADEARQSLIDHLKKLRPFGIALDVRPGATGNGFAAKTSGPAYDAARTALAAAWGGKTVSVATGGSIPLVNALHTAVPDAEILLLGATDGFSNIHAPNERVLLDEFRKTVIAEALFFQEYAARWSAANGRGASELKECASDRHVVLLIGPCGADILVMAVAGATLAHGGRWATLRALFRGDFLDGHFGHGRLAGRMGSRAPPPTAPAHEDWRDRRDPS